MKVKMRTNHGPGEDYIALLADSDEIFGNEEVSPASSEESLDSKYEKSLSLIGFGPFQWFLSTLCVLANASDAIEILCISFVLPAAECDLDLSTTDKGYLSSITFAGMMIGGFVWGTLADISGRKIMLIQALLFNAIFAMLSGLSQSFITLLVFRFLSGIGVGGSIPVVWSYFSEFIPKSIRGRMLCCLASGWLLGNLLVIFLGYMILNQTINIVLFSMFKINSWRVFMIACSVPSIITALLFMFLPESPKFCIYNGQIAKARQILQRIYLLNHKRQKNLELRKIAFDHFGTIKSHSKASLSDDDSLQMEIMNAQSVSSSRIVQVVHYFKSSTIDVFKKTKYLFESPHTTKTLIVLYVMFALCFSYYGLWMWLPELYKRMDANGGSPCSASGASTSTNSSARAQNRTCLIEDNIYISSFISSMSNLPGNLFTIIFIDRMGRNIITSVSLLASGLSVLGIPFITSEFQGLILTTIFGGINVLTFNSFGCTSTEIYPTKLRSTAMGVQYVAGRLGAILGNLLFGMAVDISCYIPLLTITCLLISSGLLSFKLPESKKADIN